ncbi:MAG: outer membrane protein OmpA-like peptidoglycan-associated protein, partial [Candidatus Azotimanducaceae bacterium]
MKNLIFFLFAACALNAFGLKYETELDASQWVNDSSRFSCRLEHYITGFGTGAFLHNAGEDRRLALDGQGIAFGGQSVTIRTIPPNWRPGVKGMALGQLKPDQGEVRVGEVLATNVASELLRGMMISFEGALRESETQPIAVQLSTVGFRKAFDDFAVCEDQLAAASFSQLERSRVQYKVGQIELGDTGKGLLSKIVDYINVDGTVLQIFIDGHTDDTGLTRDNIVMSQQRAERVREYLLAEGVLKDMLVVRYHAEKYPVARNTSAVNRAKNRRT